MEPMPVTMAPIEKKLEIIVKPICSLKYAAMIATIQAIPNRRERKVSLFIVICIQETHRDNNA